MSNKYRVIWEIDIEADSPAEAAMKAEEIQEEQYSSWCGGVFRVTDKTTQETTEVDLTEYYQRVEEDE